MNLSPPTIWAIIAVHNRRPYTRRCLQQLNRQTVANLRIIVVDDGSTDGTSEMVVSEFPDVKLIHGDGTLYWTPSMRIGVSYAIDHCSDDDYLFVVNDDLEFHDNFVEILFLFSKSHPEAVVHALSVYADNPDLIAFGGIRVNWWLGTSHWINRGKSRKIFSPGHSEESDLLWGRGLIARISAVRRIGNYCSDYQQCGDGELSRRAAKMGYRLLVAYDAVAVMQREKPEEVGRYAMTDIYKFFFDVLSMGRLRYLWLNAKHYTNSRLQAATFFICSAIRLLVHFLTRVRRI